MVTKKQALLVVTGEGSFSDILTLLYLQPSIMYIITSKQAWNRQQVFLDVAQHIGCQIKRQMMNAHDYDACLQACRSVSASLPEDEWDWIFTISSAPQIIGIAAYEVAKEKQIPCWHVDAQRDCVVSLVKPVKIDRARFFHLTLDQYMHILHRSSKLASPTGTESYRDTVKKWVDIAKELSASKSSYTAQILSFLCIEKGIMQYGTEVQFYIPPDLVSSSALGLLEERGLLSVRRTSSGKTIARFTSLAAAQFIGTGDWLKFSVWHAVMRSGLADEQHCQWRCKIEDICLYSDRKTYSEFDLMLMYKSQLIVAECKAEQAPFRQEKNYLARLEAKANLLGGSSVTKLFITNQLATGDRSYRAFSKRAEEYKIVIVTGENLDEVDQIVKQEAERSTYPSREILSCFSPRKTNLIV